MGLPVTFDNAINEHGYPEEAVFKVVTLFGYVELRTNSGVDEGKTFACDYIRIVESVSGDPADAVEHGYWHCDEWQEDPKVVLGAILGALSGTHVEPIDGAPAEPRG